jgi:hypothetical protein
MCMLCAAVPVTVAIGVNLNNKQNATLRAAEKEGIQPPARKPIAKIILGAIIFLTVGSVIYHTVIARIFGLPWL